MNGLITQSYNYKPTITDWVNLPYIIILNEFIFGNLMYRTSSDSNDYIGPYPRVSFYTDHLHTLVYSQVQGFEFGYEVKGY